MKRYFSEAKSWLSGERYEAVHTGSEDEIDRERAVDRVCPTCLNQGSRTSRLRDVILVTGAVIMTAVVFLFSTLLRSTFLTEKNPTLRECTHYSPYLDEVKIITYNTLMNGTLFSPPNPSIARQEPSPENDADWLSLVNTPIFRLTRDEVIKLGKDPALTAAFDGGYWGLDEDPYIGKFDISHEIHCVDLLRRKAFADYPGYTPLKHKHVKGAMEWVHLGHCVDMLLQFIQCNGDPAVLTMSWVDGQEAPWPDFNINRQCRRYDDMMEWAAGRAFDHEKFTHAPRSKGAHVWPNPFADGEVELGFPLGHHHLQEGKSGGLRGDDL